MSVFLAKALWILIGGWLAALAALVIGRTASGEIAMAGALSDHLDGPAPERLAAFAAVLFALGQWLLGIAASGPPDGHRTIADFPAEGLAVLIGGQSIFLGGKVMRRHFNRSSP